MMRRARSVAAGSPSRLVLALALAMALSACVYYPNPGDIDGVTIRPHNGRAVRQADQVAFYVDIANSGRSPDVLMAVKTPVARRADIVGATGAPVSSVEVPGTATALLHPGGPHVLLTDLTRPLQAGEVFLVPLVFEKTGTVGVITQVE